MAKLEQSPIPGSVRIGRHSKGLARYLSVRRAAPLAYSHTAPGCLGRPRAAKLWVLVAAVALTASACTGGHNIVSTTAAPLSSFTWSRVLHDEAAFGQGNQVMRSVTVGGLDLAAVGSHNVGLVTDTAVWVATR